MRKHVRGELVRQPGLRYRARDLLLPDLLDGLLVRDLLHRFPTSLPMRDRAAAAAAAALAAVTPAAAAVAAVAAAVATAIAAAAAAATTIAAPAWCRLGVRQRGHHMAARAPGPELRHRLFRGWGHVPRLPPG